MSHSAEAPGTLRKTALNAVHRQMGGKMVDFGGWDTPVEYPQGFDGRPGGLIQEHMAVRTAVGLFDVSHMGDIGFEGPQALAAVQHITMNDASRLEIGQAQYSAMLYPPGTFVDDVIVHRMAKNNFLLVINAGTREKDFNWARENARNFECQVEDAGDNFTQLAIQGPRAIELLAKLTDAALAKVKNYWFTHGTVCRLRQTLIARTGYTGEDGFEIYIPAELAVSRRVWFEILETGKDMGILPCGLGARNTLRLEAGMLLYGTDVNEATTPLEVGLGWITKLDKGAFLGREVLERQKRAGVARQLAGFRMIDRGIARDDAPVYKDGQLVGKVTSGSYVPYLKQNIGLASLPRELTKVGERITVQIRGTMAAAEIVPTPFYHREK